MWCGKSLPTFQMCLLPPPSGRWVKMETGNTWDVSKFLPGYKAQRPIRRSSSCSPPSEPYISFNTSANCNCDCFVNQRYSKDTCIVVRSKFWVVIAHKYWYRNRGQLIASCSGDAEHMRSYCQLAEFNTKYIINHQHSFYFAVYCMFRPIQVMFRRRDVDENGLLQIIWSAL
jgi:hypothetical protein